jgi:hypothetical protein
MLWVGDTESAAECLARTWWVGFCRRSAFSTTLHVSILLQNTTVRSDLQHTRHTQCVKDRQAVREQEGLLCLLATCQRTLHLNCRVLSNALTLRRLTDV